MASLPRSCLRRTACDRCRSLKLRCLWADQEGPQPNSRCLRCARLELQCDVAPPRRAGRPRKAAASAASGSRPASRPASRLSSNAARSSSSAGSAQDEALMETVPTTSSPGDMDLNMFQGDEPFLPDQNLETGGLDFQQFDMMPEHRSQPYHIPTTESAPFMVNMSQHLHPHSHSYPNLQSHSQPHPSIACSAGPPNMPTTAGNQHHQQHQQLLTTGNVSLISLPFNMELQPPPPPKLDQTQCLRELSELNMEVHHHFSLVLAEAESSPDGYASFQTFLHVPEDGVTRAERYLMLGQRFVSAISNLEWVLLDEWKDRLLSSRFQDTGRVETSDEDDGDDTPSQAETNMSSPWPNYDLPQANEDAGRTQHGPESQYHQQPFMAPENQAPWGLPLSPTPSSSASSPLPYHSHPHQSRRQQNSRRQQQQQQYRTESRSRNQPDRRPRPHPYDALATAPALLLASIYSEMITLFDAFIGALGRRLVTVDQDPMAPIHVPGKGCGIGSFYAVDSRLEGLFFVDSTRTLLDGMERRLGVLEGQERRARNLGYNTDGTMGVARGLFTGKKRYRDILIEELGRGDVMPRGGKVDIQDEEYDDDMEQADGMVRPKRLRETMDRVRNMMTNDPFW